MKYSVDVIVTTTFNVVVEADSYDEAESKALNMEYSEMKEVSEVVEANPQTLVEN